MPEEQRTFLQSMAEQLVEWDKELNLLKNRAAQSTGEKKEQLDKMVDELKSQADHLKAKVDEYRNKSPDEFKAEGEHLLRSTSGKIADGLKHLASFFEGKATREPPKTTTGE